jgi:hypothetical protein
LVASLCGLGTPSFAEPPITDRDYAIDFYEGTAVGDARMVAMGGAGLALINGSAGLLLNASAPAVRLTTDNDHWTFDWHFDYLNGQLSSDYDNNGVSLDKASGAQLLTLGASLRVGKWAGGFTATVHSAPIDGAIGELKAQNAHARIGVARWFPDIDTSIGVGVQTIAFRMLAGADEENMFDISGGGLIAGATWLPRMQDFRAALVVETPIIGGKVSTSACDPMACMIGMDGPYILPSQVEASAKLGIGGAYRWGPTEWNQLVKPKFRDERTFTVAADLWIIGPSKNGYGLEKFGMQELQRSGSSTNVGARAGIETEALPGRLRLRAGTYWEPARFAGVSGRLHGTFGIEVRVFEFRAWGLRRGRIGMLTDLAARYRNIGLSVGLWH